MELRVIFSFTMLFSLYVGISYDVISVKNFREILGYFFWILAMPLKDVSNNHLSNFVNNP